MDDCLIVGAGVIGLSIACELAATGRKVRVVDRTVTRDRTSWAAAGILPAVAAEGGEPDDWERFRAASYRLFPSWSADLLEQTGIDVEYRTCGAIHLARSKGEVAAINATVHEWRLDGVEFKRLDGQSVAELEPHIDVAQACVGESFFLPSECRIRPPRLLQALQSRCEQLGVAIETGVEVGDWRVVGNRINSAICADHPRAAGSFVLTAGAWSDRLARPLGISLDIEPWRGHMVLFPPGETVLRHIINEGPNYMVPRDDGRILVGSTMDEVGFVREADPRAIEELTAYARQLLPCLNGVTPEAHWTGLRPASSDGKPHIGRASGWDNLIVATGHFRAGVFLAPITARLVCQLMSDQEIDLPTWDVRPIR